MGLTVHARFDDGLERNNGVATFTFSPAGAGTQPRSRCSDAVLEINVQLGSVDVTNPDPNEVELPEVITVTRSSGALTIERRSGSTLLGASDLVLDDDAVRELFEQSAAVADAWRRRINDSLVTPRWLQTVALDFEFELAMVIGRGGINIAPERALDHVFGYMIYNDFSERTIQAREMTVGLGPA